MGIDMLLSDPTLLEPWNAEGRRQWAVAHGLPEHGDTSLLGLLAPIVDLRGDTNPDRMAVHKYMSGLPWYQNIATHIGTDPTLLFPAAGIVGKGIEAYSGGEGLLGAIKALSLETAHVSGIPGILKGGYDMVPFVGGAARTGKLSEAVGLRNLVDTLLAMVKEHPPFEPGTIDLVDPATVADTAAHGQAVKDALNSAIVQAGGKGTADFVSVADTPQTLARRLLNLTKWPDLKKAVQGDQSIKDLYGLFAHDYWNLYGLDQSAADHIGQAQKLYKAIAPIQSITDPNTEMLGAIKGAAEAAAALAADPNARPLALKIPAVQRALAFADPNWALAGSGNPAQAAMNVIRAHIEGITQSSGQLSEHLARISRNAGFAPDTTNGLLRGFQAASDGTPANIWNVFTQPQKFADQLNMQQRMAIQALHIGTQNEVSRMTTFLNSLPDGTKAEKAIKDGLFEQLAPTIANAYGPEGELYMHRMAILMGPAGQDFSDVSALRRIAVRLHLPTPIGSLGVPGAGRSLPGQEPESLLGKLAAKFYGSDIAIPKDYTAPSVDAAGLFGGQKPFEMARVLDAPNGKNLVFSTNPGDMFQAFRNQLNTLLLREGVLRPILEGLGKTPEEIIGADLAISKASTTASRDLGGKILNKLVAEVAQGKTNAKTEQYLRSLADSERLPAPVVDTVHAAADMVKNHQMAEAATGRGTEKLAETAAKASGQMLTAAEERALARHGLPSAPGTSYPEARPGPMRETAKKLGERAADLTGAGEAPPVIPDDGTTRLALKRLAQEELGQNQAIPAGDVGDRVAEVRARLAQTGQTANDAYTNGLREAPPTPNLLTDAAGHKEAMQNFAKDWAIPVLEAHMQESGAELGRIKGMMAAALRQGTQGKRQLADATFKGPWYDNVMADYIDSALNPQANPLLQKTVLAQAGIQTTIAGSSFHATFMQALATLANTPGGWLQALARGVTSLVAPENYARYLSNMSTTYDIKSGKSWLQLATEGGLHLSPTEDFSPSAMAAGLGASNSGNIARINGFISRMPLNRGFSIQRNVASMELFKSQYALESALGTVMNPEAVTSIARQVNLATGYVSNAALGIKGNQAAGERLLGRFGVQWFRSQTGRLVQATQMGTLDGSVARRLLIRQMAAMTSLYAAASYANGQTPDFNPASKNFLAVKVAGQKVAFGGVYPSLMKAIGKTVDAVATGNEGNLVDMQNGKNPLLNFYKSGAPTIGKMIADAVGVDAKTSYAQSPLDELSPTQIAPIDVQAALGANGTLLQRAMAAGIAGTGLRDTPLTTTDIWTETANQYAKEHGAATWQDIPVAAQDKALQTNPELKAAFDANQAWFDAHGQKTPLDTVIKANDRSKAAENDVLAGLWAKVQTGQLTKAQFRTEFMTWEQNHAYFTKQLFGGLPADQLEILRQPKNNQTVQDNLAAQYQAIQPVDDPTTGNPTAQGWADWRTKQAQFWVDHPEAVPYRQYITVDYPQREWTNPVAAAGVADLKANQVLNSTYLDIPKYKGMSVDEGKFVDGVISAKSEATAQLTQMAIQAGVPENRVKIPARLAWAFTLQQLGGVTAHEAQLIKIAAVIDGNQKAKLQLIAPGRLNFLRQNRALMDYYPFAAAETGIPTKILEALGLLQAAPGVPVATRAPTLLSLAQ